MTYIIVTMLHANTYVFFINIYSLNINSMLYATLNVMRTKINKMPSRGKKKKKMPSWPSRSSKSTGWRQSDRMI